MDEEEDGFSSSPLLEDDDEEQEEEDDGFSSSASSPAIPTASRIGSIFITVPSEATSVGYGVATLFLIFRVIFPGDAGVRNGVLEGSPFLDEYFMKKVLSGIGHSTLRDLRVAKTMSSSGP